MYMYISMCLIPILFQLAACNLATHLMEAADQMTEHLRMENTPCCDDLKKPYQDTMHACFNLGFDVSVKGGRVGGEDGKT